MFLTRRSFCRFEEADLKELFATVIQQLKERRLIYFIDALDECDRDGDKTQDQLTRERHQRPTCKQKN